jgi:cell division protein ZapA (FtsZ GTPase activity inhibitor)
MCRLAVKRTIKIHVAGQQYMLRSDADEDYVQALADSVNARINALKGSRQVATQSDVVLAALKLADELQHEQQVQTELRSQVGLHARRMLIRVEQQLAQAVPTAAAAVALASPPARVGRSRRPAADPRSCEKSP